MMKEIKGIGFKPSHLMDLVDHETQTKKIKIIGFSMIMFSVAGYYQWFFGNVVMRSGQNQMYNLGKNGVWLNYWTKYDFDEDDVRKSWHCKYIEESYV